jgi:hypothetical protein
MGSFDYLYEERHRIGRGGVEVEVEDKAIKNWPYSYCVGLSCYSWRCIFTFGTLKPYIGDYCARR